MTTGNIKQLDSCVLHSQRISASNGNVIKHPTVLAEKLHSIDNTQRVLRLGFTKGNITPTMNKQGTLFMGMPKMAMPMKPGYIRSLAHEQRGINNPIKYQGGPVYNPLNKHGNTFQGIPKSAVSTRPGFIRSLADERLGINNMVKYQGGLVYNPLNKHGNAFQGFSATVKTVPEVGSDVSKRSSIDIGFDDYLFESYALFPEENKEKVNEVEANFTPSDHDGDLKSLNFESNGSYYKIVY